MDTKPTGTLINRDSLIDVMITVYFNPSDFMHLAGLISRLDTYESPYDGYGLQEALGYNPNTWIDLSVHGYTRKTIYQYKHPDNHSIIGKYLILRDKKHLAILTDSFMGKAGIFWLLTQYYEETRDHIQKLHSPKEPEQEWADLSENLSEYYRVPSIKCLIAGVHTKAIYLGEEYTIDWGNSVFRNLLSLEYPEQIVPLKKNDVLIWVMTAMLSFPIHLK